MHKSPRVRAISLAAAAVALLALLGFLFAKTESSEYKSDLQALTLLRELRDMDARWDNDAERLAADLGRAPAAGSDRAVIFGRILQELQNPPAGDARANPARALRAMIADKEEAYRQLQRDHAASVRALATARAALQELSRTSRANPSRTPGAPVSALAEQLAAELQHHDADWLADIGRRMEPRLGLLEMAGSADARLKAATTRALEAARDFLALRSAEGEALARLQRMTVSSRIDLATREMSLSIEAALDEKERWRVYLLAYAAALLVGVGYLVKRVAAAQAALREANQLLERRVAERTRDLETTLRQLKESEAQLVQSEKMSSLGQLVAGVAHEINTPLAYVKNSVATVRDHMDDLAATVRESAHLVALLESAETDPNALQLAHETLATRVHRLEEYEVMGDLDTLTHDGLHGIEQISELVANLRNFSRLDRSRMASFNVNEGVRATLLIAKPALRKVDVEKRLGEIPSITCSPSQVNQVLLNLVTNAVQAVDKPRGRIIVSTRREGGDAIAIEVEDNGRGIAPEIMGRIFDPFFTTKDAGKGTGLGLSIAYKIVAQHQGRIDVRSAPGEGSTFTVILPVNASGAAQEEPAVPEEAAA